MITLTIGQFLLLWLILSLVYTLAVLGVQMLFGRKVRDRLDLLVLIARRLGIGIPIEDADALGQEDPLGQPLERCR